MKRYAFFVIAAVVLMLVPKPALADRFVVHNLYKSRAWATLYACASILPCEIQKTATVPQAVPGRPGVVEFNVDMSPNTRFELRVENSSGGAKLDKRIEGRSRGSGMTWNACAGGDTLAWCVAPQR